jgi:ribosomal-protein-alanine N-acetyltransferase
VGERLLVRALDASREREARRVTLEVRKSNSVAISLYKKYGFREAAVRRGYYSDNGEDALIMWVDDLWSPEFTSVFAANKARLQALETG